MNTLSNLRFSADDEKFVITDAFGRFSFIVDREMESLVENEDQDGDLIDFIRSVLIWAEEISLEDGSVDKQV